MVSVAAVYNGKKPEKWKMAGPVAFNRCMDMYIRTQVVFLLLNYFFFFI